MAQDVGYGLELPPVDSRGGPLGTFIRIVLKSCSVRHIGPWPIDPGELATRVFESRCVGLECLCAIDQRIASFSKGEKVPFI